MERKNAGENMLTNADYIVSIVNYSYIVFFMFNSQFRQPRIYFSRKT